MAQSAPEDKAVRIRIDQSTGSVSLSDAEASDLAESAQQADPKAASEQSVQIQRPVESSAWVLEPSAYSRSVVGGKSHNLVSLAAMSAEIELRLLSFSHFGFGVGNCWAFAVRGTPMP